MAYEFELNVDFDLSLRRGWGGLANGSQARQTEEMALHSLLVGGSRDSVRLPAEPPEEFLDSLEKHGIEHSNPTIRPAINPTMQLRPFGWNSAVSDLNNRYDRPVAHPSLQVVRRVNDRRFAVAIENDLQGEGFRVGICDTVDGVQAFLSAATDGGQGWVAKSAHGNAGLGNRRLRGRRLSDTDRRWLQATLTEDECVLLEPWIRRVADLCVTMDLDSAGETHGLMTHEIINTADGSFIGAVFEPSSAVCQTWIPQLDTVAYEVGRRLSRAGYFGPVCFDALVWSDAGNLRLRSLVDLNARLNVSRGADRLQRMLGGTDVVYWRLFSRRKVSLPGTHARLEAELGRDAFDSESRRGVLVTSPLWTVTDGRQQQLRRFGVAFVGRSRTEVMQQEQRFRERFEG